MSDTIYSAESPAGARQPSGRLTAVVPGAPEAVEVAECAGRLDTLVASCVSFLQGQLHRLDEAYKEFEELQNSLGGGTQQGSELTEQQAAWERRQAEEESRINEQLDCLTQAWSRLEDEQRQQMAAGQTSPEVARTFESTLEDPAAESVSIPVDLIDAPCDLSSSAAEIQFQKLKREIRQHTRRSR